MPSKLLIGAGDQSVEALRRELAEAREQQAATAEILGVISNSPTDLRRAFTEIAASAARLCDANDAATIHQVDGGAFRLVAHRGPIPAGTLPLVRGMVTGRAVMERRTVHVADLQAETDEFPEGSDRARSIGFRTILAVPLIREGEAIGVIAIRRREVRLFSDRQIALLQTFASQAVIAIENARLFEEVQARTHDLQESLEHQTATADVLAVISKFPNQLQPVFEAIAQTSRRLCRADRSAIVRLDGGVFRVVARAGSGNPTSLKAAIDASTIPISRASVMGRAVLECRAIHIEDIRADPEYSLFREVRSDDRRTMLGVPLINHGKVIGVINLVRTIVQPFTARQVALVETFAGQAVIAIENARLFEEIARKSRELEIASQHKSQFVANMSHELRTPLAAILGYAELMQEGFYEPVGQKSLDALTRIRANGKHLLGLINTVLDIAKIESGQFSLNLSEYALENVVETVRAATESLAETKKLSLKADIAKDLPVGLGDEQRLTQVLLNLVGNAIKFTDAGEVRIVVTTVDGHFGLSVSDTGPGIPPDQLTRVFEQFHQVDSSDTKAKGGTGLGLAIAKQIVEMHGGRIWVESSVGQGSTFRMELPVRAAVTGGGP
jgi:signal transduction histidine kinase